MLNKKYYIYDNGLRPYVIYIKNFNVLIYNNLLLDNNLIESFITKKIFIGDKLINNDTFTILLFIDKNDYVIINKDGIEKFSTNNDKIIKYYSLGNIYYPEYSIGVGKKYIYFFGYHEGYLPISEFPKIINKNNLKEVFQKGCQLEPFLISLFSNKTNNNEITLEEFKEIQKKRLDEIPLKKIKELAKLFGVILSGSKKELVNRIEEVRNIIVYKKF